MISTYLQSSLDVVNYEHSRGFIQTKNLIDVDR
jgi:hypothetical protein